MKIPKNILASKVQQELNTAQIGKSLKSLRKAKKLTQEELGKKVGVQKAQISKIENHTKDVRFETILKVFRALDAKITFRIEHRK